MNLDDLAKQQSAWLRGDGVDSDVVVSSRIRLARNLCGFPFVDRATRSDLQTIVDLATQVVKKKFPSDGLMIVDFTKISQSEARFFFERQLVSKEFVEADRPRALILDKNEEFSVMVNEEDHLRIQTTLSGFALPEARARIDAFDNLFEAELEYAFDEKWGYLTASPSNVGTGLRASAMLHLPALIETGEIAKVFRGLQKMNLMVRGIYGDNSHTLGEFFQICNLATLGVSEESIVDQLCEVVPCIVSYERKARQTTLEKDREGLLDRCYRAMGLLSSARETTLPEAMEWLSSLRLGTRLKLLDAFAIEQIDELLITIQPAHLRRWADSEGIFEDDENIIRAEYLRDKLSIVEPKRK